MDNADWQRISTQYTTEVFLASQKLNSIPSFIRPVAHWFVPECKRVRALLKEAHKLIDPEVKRRMEELKKHGGPRRRVLDSVDWFVASSKANSKFDIAAAEISLAMASIHTTSTTIAYLLMDLLQNPEYAQDLRDECVAVMKETGVMDKSALFKMKKMDSFLRESMRLHGPVNGKPQKKEKKKEKGPR